MACLNHRFPRSSGPLPCVTRRVSSERGRHGRQVVAGGLRDEKRPFEHVVGAARLLVDPQLPPQSRECLGEYR